MPTRETCESCGVELVWLSHARTKKPAPIEAAPSMVGNVVPCVLLIGPGGVEILEPCAIDNATHYRVLGPPALKEHRALEDPPPLWISHFATCPQAPHWRDRQKGGADEPSSLRNA